MFAFTSTVIYGGSTCPPTTSLGPGISTYAWLAIQAGGYKLAIVSGTPASGPLLFLGTVTASGPPCKITKLNFVNTVVPGTPYTLTILGSTYFMFGAASSGTVAVTFKKTCCP